MRSPFITATRRRYITTATTKVSATIATPGHTIRLPDITYPRERSRRRMPARCGSDLAGQHQLLDFADRPGGVQPLGAGPRAVHDGVAAVELERILEVVQARAGVLVARIGDPAVGLEQDGGPEVAVAVPPVAGAGRAAAGAEDAFVQAVEPGTVFLRLQALAVRRRRALGADPGLDRGVLREEVRQVGNEVPDHLHVRQRVDRHPALAAVVDGLGAGQGVGAVDVHRAGAADALAAGAAEGQRGVDLVLDLDQRIENHRPALVEVDLVGVGTRVFVVVRAPSVDLELAHAGRSGRRGEVPALVDLRVPGK